MHGFYWLASYPKSGNTWLRLALASVARDGAPVDLSAEEPAFPPVSSRRLFDHVLEIDSSNLTPVECERLRPRVFELLARDANAPMIRKVHDSWHDTADGEPLFPPDVTLGVLYLVRDPRDVAVSFAAYMSISIDEAISRMQNPAHTLTPNIGQLHAHMPQRLGRWSDHVQSWVDNRAQRTSLIRYEDLLTDPTRVIADAARFLGWSPSARAIERAVAATRFDVLQRQEALGGFPERTPTARRFFRRGTAGEWRQVLNAEQILRIECTHGDVMRRLGYVTSPSPRSSG